MHQLKIDILREAGDWPAKSRLKALANDAVVAAIAAISGDSPTPGANGPPSPHNVHKPDFDADSEVSIVFTDDSAVRLLNKRWRGKDGSTNVLSFPQPGGKLLGDVILAAETVRAEAADQEKSLEDHTAHLIIHGFLHLLGYDHEVYDDAERMEEVERVALKRMGIADPYAAA